VNFALWWPAVNLDQRSHLENSHLIRKLDWIWSNFVGGHRNGELDVSSGLYRSLNCAPQDAIWPESSLVMQDQRQLGKWVPE
jgi:hypothetical protein